MAALGLAPVPSMRSWPVLSSALVMTMVDATGGGGGGAEAAAR